MTAPRITIEDGKYTLVMDPGALRAERYGEPWRDLCGDGFVMALGHEIEDLREKIDAAHTAARETAPDWETRCRRIMAALGLDFGDAESAQQRAERHAVDLEQCGLFVDSEPLQRAMFDAAAFLRDLIAPPAAPEPRPTLAAELQAIRDRYTTATPDKTGTPWAVLTRAIEALRGPTPAPWEQSHGERVADLLAAGNRLLERARAAERRLAAFDWVAGLYEGEELTRDKIADELHDLHMISGEVPRVYCHVTGGKISKANTCASAVIAEADDALNESVEYAVKEALAEVRVAMTTGAETLETTAGNIRSLGPTGGLDGLPFAPYRRWLEVVEGAATKLREALT